MMNSVIATITLSLQLCVTSLGAMDWIQVSDDKRSFKYANSGKGFKPWGVNYDHDHSGRLLDEYWVDEWQTVVDDFQEIKALGANCVRIHLQFGKFMDSEQKANEGSLLQLAKLLKLAEESGLYLDITGLACYHKANIPDWYDRLSEKERWESQAVFWKAIATICKDSPAVFCYDLMNEPVIGGGKSSSDWLAGEPLGDKFFVQRIALDLKGRTNIEVADQWLKMLTTSIREIDSKRLITVGVIPWAHVWPNAKPIFYAPEPSKHLDFVSVHFYPEAMQIPKAITALKVYDIGKPIVIEEMFPLKCSTPELMEFIKQSEEVASGWISFYWGRTIDELDQNTIAGKITADWLTAFKSRKNK